ncbi:hypothetical protein JAAARDRAFT_196122 [Jaapia argillacea MUCL 33604]|uniref:Uncharacterized protein n=1 Tax=Jaapia argillacea MUCL 33604 TaxID=933084 RepID=A0A067PN99_9AGAM|nr:hypothetical protein JAAARDRAFT_196122 [Jaapia argillacea MUCL 33604]
MNAGGGGCTWRSVNQALVFTIISSITILSIACGDHHVLWEGPEDILDNMDHILHSPSHPLRRLPPRRCHAHLRTLRKRSIGSKDVKIVYWKHTSFGDSIVLRWIDVDAGKITIIDLADSPLSTLLTTLFPAQDIYLIALLYATSHIRCLVLQQEIFPHLNLDHRDEVWEVGLRID